MDYSEKIYELLRNDNMQIITLITSFISTILWGIYVFYTIKTFNQIRKQTDLQSRAFLMVTPKICALSDELKFIKAAIDLQEKWKKILDNNLHEANIENNAFIFELTNRGKSDIVSWSIRISIKISAGDYLFRKFGISGENFSLDISSTSDQTIAPNQTIKVPVILVGDFPSISFDWDISYKDLMEGEYNTRSYENGFESKNLIAFSFNG